MLRINSLGVVLILMILISVGCSSTQEKSSIMVEGGYRFSSTITDSNCMMPDITKGASNNTIVIISQNGTKLTWSQFLIGENMQGIQTSKIEGNQAKFIDMKTNFTTSDLKWNATILISNTGLAGIGDFKVQECEGMFKIEGTRIQD